MDLEVSNSLGNFTKLIPKLDAEVRIR
uniref:Uncharacterized protein n=1 Tax=Rhizophora mucronata TaxID=61149 RepID=A0A2P2QI20_RHIMU